MSSDAPSASNVASPHPPFSSLPLDPNGPRGNAWGRFGSTDQLGMLNLLTPTVVAAAAKEIVTGVRVSLDWPLNRPVNPSYGRDPLKHEIQQRVLNGTASGTMVFSTPSSEDNVFGLAISLAYTNIGNQKQQRYYNNNTHDQILSSSAIGIETWASNGGIVGRGILLDYQTWASKNSVPLAPLSSSSFPFSHLCRLIADYNIDIRLGDILFIRSGFTAAYNALSPTEQQALSKRSTNDFLGIESTEEVLEWLWENQFAAVAGDSPSFERSPVGGGKGKNDMLSVVLHQWLLAGWGMPIGEMFDLEELARHCWECGRWSFFLCSVPLKVPGGVASPANAVAIF